MLLHTILIKPASGLCNMRCSYCFYCDEMDKREEGIRGMMSVDTVKNLIKKAMRQAGDEICFAFQGGEPTLRGLDFFREVIRLEKRFNRRGIRVINTIQTNGFALDEEWCRFFKEHDFLIGLSVDGTQEIHDRYRHDASGGVTYARVKKAADLQYSLGMLSRENYLAAEAAWLDGEAAWTAAGLDLTAAMENYEWAIKGLLDIGSQQS